MGDFYQGLRSPSFGPPDPKRRPKDDHKHHHHHYHHHHGPRGFFPYGPPRHHHHPKHGHYWPPPPPPPPPYHHHHRPPPPMAPYPPYFYYPPGPPPPGPPPPRKPDDGERRESYGYYPPFPPGPPPPPPGHFGFPPPPHFYGHPFYDEPKREEVSPDSESSDTEEPKKGPFSAGDLKRHELPVWPVLSDILAYYYRVCHPNDQLLPSKSVFLQSLFLRNDAALLHAVIARVCALGKWSIDRKEETWVERTHKYMDTLDDHGMLVCYTLLRKTPSVRSDPAQLSDVKAKFAEIVDSNKYMELLSTSVNMNRRKRMDREMKVRAIWSFWIDNAVASEEYVGVFDDAEKAKFPLPVANESYARGEIAPSSWEDFNNGKLNDFTSLIRAAMALNKSRKEPIVDASLESFLKVYYTLQEDRIVLNPHMASARCLYSQAQIELKKKLPVEKQDMKDEHWKSLAEVSKHVGEICEVVEVARGYGSHPIVFGSSQDWTGSVAQGRDGWRRVSSVVISSAEAASEALTKVIFLLESTTRVEPELDSHLLRKHSQTLSRFLRFCEPVSPSASPLVKDEEST
ncbi:uncharacterized protein CXQ87_002011 [Candidozyma duobushaemuli]|uniref:Uncharacterized protein n=2 Tax=Candidozyma TaxID=3303203 RepID=A0ABX8I453_9ASCO|nr:uncharacterized protein CXQ87_002011 [[Candida] duobushaemulonis]PVH13893.1 hypothetical protein CXQ87_002011 [[Candida] duobushaemulonis]QWU87887.1 hypothetical protein CA3LBN_002152 [[Candida] haemuloni]